MNVSDFLGDAFLEGLSETSDDFLSNGFHDFYNEFQEEPVDLEFIDYAPQLDHHPSSDLDIDQFLIDFPAPSPSSSSLDALPEITPLCSDACSTFINGNFSEHLRFDPATSSANFDDLKTLMCPFEGCQKLYAKPTHLKAHMKRHLNDKPYVCKWPECKWRFSRSDELARHRRSHLGIKPYRCSFCPKAFARSDHLTKHRRVHEKKFSAQNISPADMICWPAMPKGRPGRKPKPK